MIIYKEPYDIWIEDDFLSDSELGIIEDAWPSLNSELWHRGHEYINEKKNPLKGHSDGTKMIDFDMFRNIMLLGLK
tara:strand:- start:1707 stop:1934 length:228 start_codon:yes stop_codon:yes gene_type:complete